jgi:hypothetical protein
MAPSPRLEIMSMYHAAQLDSGPSELGPETDPVMPNYQPSIMSPSRNPTPIPEASRGSGVLALKTMKICKDSPLRGYRLFLDNQAEAESPEGSPPIPPDDATDDYMKLYFTHFHHRWPIIHRPEYDGHTNKLVFLYSIFMIGGWLSGTTESKKYALAMHDYLMLHISTLLVSLVPALKILKFISLTIL